MKSDKATDERTQKNADKLASVTPLLSIENCSKATRNMFHHDISQPQIKDRPELAQNRKLTSIKCQESDLIGQTCVH